MRPVMGLFVMVLAVAGYMTSVTAAPEIEVHKKYGIKYVTGGNSPEERKELEHIAPKFPMQLYFVVEGSDEPIKGVKVTVRDIQREVILEATAEGPLFYLEVTGGRYTVEADYKGEKQSYTKDLTGRRYLFLEYKFKPGT